MFIASSTRIRDCSGVQATTRGVAVAGMLGRLHVLMVPHAAPGLAKKPANSDYEP